MRLQPLGLALAGLGWRIAWLWAGDAASRDEALALGLPPDAPVAPAADFSQADVLAVAHADLAALACAETFAAMGRRIVRVGAGARAFVDDRAARELDRRSHVLLCATDAQRENLRRDGIGHLGALVAGCGIAAAGRALRTTASRPEVALWLDGEWDRDRILAAVQDAAQAHGLQVQERRAPRDLAGAVAVVTDRDHVQALACGMQIPCVTAAHHTARPETVACGANRIAGDEPRAIARALHVALEAPRAWADPYTAALDAEQLRAALAGPAQQPPLLLPSDADFSGRALGAEETEAVGRAIRSGTLNSTRGTSVAAFERAFAEHAGRAHAIACSSGSAAVHAAIAAIGLEPGDEVVTTPITDMGALSCICYEGGVPVFADVDPTTMNVTAASIAAQLTARTRAIVVTHLFGLLCDMQPIVELARSRGIPILEDCAQAFGACSAQGGAGSFGAIACFSLQQGKHMTTGEGGVVVTDDPQLARRLFLFVNKAWGYGDEQPDHYFPAPNARMTELQGAVALPQLQKLPWVLSRRRETAAAITRGLTGTPGLQLPQEPAGGRHSWWKYAFFVDAKTLPGGAVALGARMKAKGVACVPRYVQKPAFECALFRDFLAHPVTRMPLEHNPRRHRPQPLFARADYPGAVAALDSVVVLPIDELYEDRHVDFVCAVIQEQARALRDA